MSYLFDLLSNFFGFQVEVLWTAVGIMNKSHMGLYPLVEKGLLEVFKLCLFVLEILIIYILVNKFIDWYELRTIAYNNYLEISEETKLRLNQEELAYK